MTRNFLALASGEAVARVIAFAGTIYIARTLGPEFYGIIGFATAVVLYFSRIADGGMEYFGLGIREIAEDHRRVESTAPDLMTARFVVSAVLVLFLFALGLLLPQPDGSVVALYGLTLLMVGASTRWIHVGLERTRFVAIARALGEAVMVLLVILLVRGSGDIARVPLAQFVGDALAMLLMFGALTRRGFRLPIRLDLNVAKPFFRRAAPLVASALLGLMIYNCDLILLRFFRDTASVGYYAAGYALISFMLNLGVSYSQSLMPTFTRLGNAERGQLGLYHTSLVHVYAVTLPIAAGGFLLAPQLLDLVFGQSYLSGTTALRILIWTIPLAMFREVALVVLVSGGRQRAVLRLTGWAAALNLVLNLVLIPPFGMIGAAGATLATELARTTTALVFARSDGFRVAAAARFWRPTIATLGMAALVLLADSPILWVGLGIGLLAYPATLAGLGGIRLRRDEPPALTL
ncbi:MAG TPA: flippase [Longimicrobiales bacterium]